VPPPTRPARATLSSSSLSPFLQDSPEDSQSPAASYWPGIAPLFVPRLRGKKRYSLDITRSIVFTPFPLCSHRSLRARTEQKAQKEQTDLAPAPRRAEPQVPARQRASPSATRRSCAKLENYCGTEEWLAMRLVSSTGWLRPALLQTRWLGETRWSAIASDENAKGHNRVQFNVEPAAMAGVSDPPPAPAGDQPVKLTRGTRPWLDERGDKRKVTETSLRRERWSHT
jgi:hypothetical protein